MIDIHNYNIHLRPLAREDIEQVRTWRNSEHVRSNMIYNRIISAEEQESWFDALDNKQHYYIIFKDAVNIGVINVKNIDEKMSTGEAGIFIGDLRFTESPIALHAILALMDHYFDVLHFDSLEAKVLNENATALFMNHKLGYQTTHEDTICKHLRVTRDDYHNATSQFRALLSK